MKTILIIGAKGLIGQSIVKHLSESEINVIQLDYNCSKKLEGTEYFCDINDDNLVESLLQEIHSSYGEFHAIINCAYPKGKGYGNSLESVRLGEFNRNVELHLGGYFNVLQEGTKYFLKHSIRGKIISFGSIYGSILPDFSNYNELNFTSPVEYSVIKPGLKMLSGYFAKYYKDFELQYFTLSPGGILDGQPAEFLSRYKRNSLRKGMLEPHDLLGLVDFLISDKSKYMNGHDFIIDDGYTL